MLLGFSGSSAYALLISLIVADVTPHVSISHMSHAIEVQLKEIEDKLQGLRLRKEQVLKQQERCLEDPEYPEYRRARINDFALAIRGHIHEEEQLLQEHEQKLRQLQGQAQLLRTAVAANCSGGCSRTRHREERVAQHLQKLKERQQQKQQQRGTKRKLCRLSTSSSSSDEGSKSDGGAESDNPTAESAGGDVPVGFFANCLEGRKTSAAGNDIASQARCAIGSLGKGDIIFQGEDAGVAQCFFQEPAATTSEPRRPT